MGFEPPKIETDRLILTWPNEQQIEKYYEDIIGSNMFDTIQWDGPSGPHDLHDYWKDCCALDPKAPENELHIAIIDKDQNQYMGGAAIRPVNKNPFNADVGFALAPKFHGKGFATETVQALVNEGFSHRQSERIYANVFVGNQASRNVVEKVGFQFEGVQRRAIQKRGKWLDYWTLAITRPDWET